MMGKFPLVLLEMLSLSTVECCHDRYGSCSENVRKKLLLGQVYDYYAATVFLVVFT
jgi:hypothetical protein